MSAGRAVLGWAWLALLACGCTLTRRGALERVAKDWSETIRASQILPVYPLTEDLQPGDLFLVQETVDRQQRLYEKGGFLPLDNHLARLTPSGYAAFYGNSFGLGTPERPLPRAGLESDPPWNDAPSVAFPTYTFTTTAEGGLGLALPVRGVPLGLSLLGARRAAGTLAIADARTYGVDAQSLDLDVRDWAALNRELLASYGAQPPRNYLRVVCRVFLAGRVAISLQATETLDGEADASTPAAALSRGGSMLAVETLNQSLERQLGEGELAHVRVNALSTRSIALEETFERPLVVGYLGFDLAILPGGDLGPPVPTLAVLEERAEPRGQTFFTQDQAAYERALRKARGRDAAFYVECLEHLDPELAAAYGPAPERPYPEFTRLLRTWRLEPPEATLRHARLRRATQALLEALDATP